MKIKRQYQWPDSTLPSTSPGQRSAFTALIGAVEGHIDSPDLTIVDTRDGPSLSERLHQTDNNTVTLVLWSFYSPQFEEMSAQLRRLKQSINPPNIIHLAAGVHARQNL